MLEPYSKAYELENKVKDDNLWRMGLYVESAVTTALEHIIAGKKANSKYIEKPLLETWKEKNKISTEDEIQQRRNAFMASLEAMKSNFEAAHKKSSS